MSKAEVRTTQSKGRLVAAARALFARDGYSQTAKEAIIAAAGMTRGGFYQHYRDKADLFEAVCRVLANEAAAAVQAATEAVADPIEALEKGAVAWIDYMARPESRRILVVDSPGVLGRERWEALDRELSFDLLRVGVAEAIDKDAIRFRAGSDALAALLNGAMNEIALRSGKDDTAVMKAGFMELVHALKP